MKAKRKSKASDEVASSQLFQRGAEQSVLSACLLTAADTAKALEAGLDESCFSVSAYRQLFVRIRERFREGREISIQAVHDSLSKDELTALGDDGGYYSAVSVAGSNQFLLDNVRRLHEAADKRRAREAAQEMVSALLAGQDLATALQPLQQMAEAAQEKKAAGLADSDAQWEDYRCYLHEIVACGADCGVSTGYGKLDALTGGLQRGLYYVLGARPRMGKTALALNICLNLTRSGRRVLFVSAEMSTRRLIERCVGITGRVGMASFHQPGVKLWPGNVERASTALEDLHGKLPLFLDVSMESVSAEQLVDRVLALHRLQAFDLVVVDYLQRLRSDTPLAAESITANVGEVSKVLCRLARRLDIPLLALAMLNREGADGPRMEDLRSCGEIEQDADVVALLHRPEVSLPEKATQAERDAVRGVAMLNVAKNRDGADGVLSLRFHHDCMAFEEWHPAGDGVDQLAMIGANERGW